MRGVAIAAALLCAACASDARVSAGTDDLAARARQIQIRCFDLYPRELLARMAIDDGTPPAEVRADPALQQRYLNTEEIVEKGLFYPARLEEVLPALEEVAFYCDVHVFRRSP